MIISSVRILAGNGLIVQPNWAKYLVAVLREHTLGVNLKKKKSVLFDEPIERKETIYSEKGRTVFTWDGDVEKWCKVIFKGLIWCDSQWKIAKTEGKNRHFFYWAEKTNAKQIMKAIEAKIVVLGSQGLFVFVLILLFSIDRKWSNLLNLKPGMELKFSIVPVWACEDWNGIRYLINKENW